MREARASSSSHAASASLHCSMRSLVLPRCRSASSKRTSARSRPEGTSAFSCCKIVSVRSTSPASRRKRAASKRRRRASGGIVRRQLGGELVQLGSRGRGSAARGLLSRRLELRRGGQHRPPPPRGRDGVHAPRRPRPRPRGPDVRRGASRPAPAHSRSSPRAGGRSGCGSPRARRRPRATPASSASSTRCRSP